MKRHVSRRARHVAGMLAATLGLFSLAGCNLVATMLYVVQGASVPADFNGLRGKKVAVVCRPVTSLQFGSDSVARDLAKQVGNLLRKNVARIQVVEQREVAEWTDEHQWDEYAEIGEAMDVDAVVGIDLEEFSLYKDQTLYQGKANLAVRVYEMTQGKEPVYENALPQTLYPPTSPIASSEVPVAQFRRKFIMVLAEQVARHFYDHDATSDFANDSTAIY